MISTEELAILWLSAKVSLACIGLIIGPGIGLGWLLARKNFRGKTLLETAIMLPMVLPPVVSGYLLLHLFSPNRALGRWLSDHFGFRPIFSFSGAVLAAALVSLPLMVRAVRIAIEMVDTQLEEAARVLRASPWRIFTTITFPLAMPGILSGVILAFARGLGEFGATITFAGNIPGETQTLALAIYAHLQLPGGEHAVTRLAIITIVISFAAILIAEHSASKLKGNS